MLTQTHKSHAKVAPKPQEKPTNMSTTETTPATRGRKSQDWKHELFVKWYEDLYKVDMSTMTPAQIVGIHAARANDFRNSSTYAEATEQTDLEQLKAQEEKLAALKARFEAKRSGVTPAKPANAKASGATKAKKDNPFAA